MDDVAAMFRRVGPDDAREMFETALTEGVSAVAEPLPELLALHNRLEHRPERFSLKRIEAGRRVWLERSTLARSTQLTINFINTILAPDVAAAVGAAGLWERDVIRRNLENFNFLETITIENGLDRGGEGFQSAVRVALIHAQINRALMNNWGAEVFDAAGAPISLAGLAQGYLAFSIFPVLYDHALGHRCSLEDLVAITDYWGFVAYLFGCPLHLIPEGGEDVLDYVDHVTGHIGAPSPWAPKMADVVLESGIDSLIGTLSRRKALRPLVSPLVTRAMMPLFLGHVTEIFGVELMRAALGDGRYRNLNLDRWSRWGACAARLAVRGELAYRSVRVFLRRPRKTPGVDPMLHGLLVRYREYALRSRPNQQPTYSAHDRTSSADVRQHQAPRC